MYNVCSIYRGGGGGDGGREGRSFLVHRWDTMITLGDITSTLGYVQNTRGLP